MEQIEKILCEITRLKRELDGYTALEALDYIESYINTLPEGHNEDLEEASRNYADNEEYGDDVYYAIKAAFKAGAEWQKQKDQEIIELAEDHAMLAGMNKMKEEMMKDAVDAIFIQDYAYKKPVLYCGLKYKMNIVSGQPIKLYQIKKEQQ